ncbi:hypothetical protein [Bradyrhizobium cenepequi]|uniref:hypothetical protein n=1 Tax=Bradyrhizobium cenepequi TaxID=2821403 RepID=UPI001CE27A7B|nr:hypothetical protein [Bradyrhizobium cenepequi]MCA6107827.1 hypothetical protein [Bradyrhizobium cenepequi]
MKKLSSLAAVTAAFMLMSYSSYAVAQTAPAAGTDTVAPAANTPAPAATTATTPAATQPDSNSSTTEKAAPRKKKTVARKRTRQQEIDHSIETGTVPARYRSSVPKQYRQYIPFDKQ